MSRLERFLVVLLLLLVGVVILVGALLWFQPGERPPPPVAGIAPTSVYPGQTALAAYAAAQTVASAWQPDAQLLRATATWPQGSRRDEMLSGRAVWSFSFYSPAGGEVASVAVTEGAQDVANTRPARGALNPAAVSGWQQDSSDAVSRALAAGGDAFLSGAGIVTLNMDLNTASESGRIEWLVTLLAPQTGETFIVRLDAHSGEVIE